MINDQIRVPKVRTIDSDGKQVGILDTPEALQLAQEKNLDLVLVSPNTEPPVCRIMNYGKYRYEQTKKEKTARKHHHSARMKEIKLRPNIDKHDLQVKERRMREFLEYGFKVKVTMMFRGREMAHTQFGKEVLNDMALSVEDIAAIEMMPKIAGRYMTAIIGPKKSV